LNAHRVRPVTDRTYALTDVAAHVASGRAEDSMLISQTFAQDADVCEQANKRPMLPPANWAVHPGTCLMCMRTA